MNISFLGIFYKMGPPASPFQTNFLFTQGMNPLEIR
jgi:hypothetical protein